MLDLVREAFERAARLLVRERRHVAHRRTSLDAVEQDGREGVELLLEVARGKPADLDLLSHGRRELSGPWPRAAWSVI